MKLRPFELALVVIFLVLIFLTLLFLTSYKPKPDNDKTAQIGTVDIWGTLPADGLEATLLDLRTVSDGYRGITYRYIRPENFQTELINALADDAGPDVILIEHERLVELRSKIQPVSFDSFPQRDIRSQYLDGAQIFVLHDGLYAYPMFIDPLMLYWNRDILASDNIAQAPATWEELVNDQFGALIRRTPDRSIERAVVAMGEYDNVTNAFGVMSTLLLQAGSAGVMSVDGNRYEIRLNQAAAGQSEPLTIASEFYTRFSRPSNTLYTWNRSFTKDRDEFLGERLAFYFGYGSEGREIERLNPNLNFDISEVPQGQAATVKRVYGRVYGIAALRSSDNLTGAGIVLSTLGGSEQVQKLATQYNMAPAYRTLAAQGSNDTYGRLIYKSALVSYGWLSPGVVASDDIFRTVTKDINESRQDVSKSISDAIGRLENEY